MLKANNISSYYGNIQALDNISIEVNKGEIVSIIGSNGAGKSTLLMTLCGIVPAKSGSIFFNDIDHLSFKHEALSRNIFADGALSIAKLLNNKSPGMYSVQDFF